MNGYKKKENASLKDKLESLPIDNEYYYFMDLLILTTHDFTNSILEYS
jgi:hypothetical protein